MIDTLRISGSGLHYKFSTDYSRFTGFRKKTPEGTTSEKIDFVQVWKTDHFRCFYYPSIDKMDVELNVQKTIFKGLNHYNYESNAYNLYALIGLFGNCFFNNFEFYINRCDIGSVSAYQDAKEAGDVLEKYRHARPARARVGKWRLQNFPDSVFYPTDNYSIKIYNKGREMIYRGESPDIVSKMGLDRTLRFEKTYRTGEFERLGMKKRPYYGIHYSVFKMENVLNDYFDYFSNWEFLTESLPENPGFTGSMALLALVEKRQELDMAEARKYVSRSTLHRFKQKKKELLRPENQCIMETSEKFKGFKNNLLEKEAALLKYVYTFGPAQILFGQK